GRGDQFRGRVVVAEDVGEAFEGRDAGRLEVGDLSEEAGERRRPAAAARRAEPRRSPAADAVDLVLAGDVVRVALDRLAAEEVVVGPGGAVVDGAGGGGGRRVGGGRVGGGPVGGRARVGGGRVRGGLG